MTDDTCPECVIVVYDVPYSGENGTGYLNPERCPLCGGHLQ